MESRLAIGAMSGTSLDGLDLILVEFNWESCALESTISYRILDSKTQVYDEKLKDSLRNAFLISGSELKKLDHELGCFFGRCIHDFIQGFSPEFRFRNIDFIASHGHTVFHNPKEKYTCQIGNGPEISRETGLLTVTDFRTQDVVMGGQGAPLVPVGDKLLFSEFGACLNLGGFANISFDKNSQRLDYDVVPVNILRNYFCEKEGLNFDSEGINAKKGTININLLRELNGYSFYDQIGPKSLGKEQVEHFYLPLIESFDIGFENRLCTIVEHAAIQISRVIEPLATNVLVTGGGAYNDFLMDRIRSKLHKSHLEKAETTLLEFKEALIFAFLGLLRIQDLNNVFASVTGAERDHSSGIIHRVN